MTTTTALPYPTRPLAPAEQRMLTHVLTGDARTAGWAQPLLDAALARDVVPGTRLLEEGDPVGELLVLLDGLVEVRRSGALLDHPVPGALLGARASSTDVRNTTAVTAVTRGVVAVLPPHDARRAQRHRTALSDRFGRRAAPRPATPA